MAKIDFTRERTYGKSFDGVLKIQGHVLSEENLPLSAENGDIYSVGEDNTLYIFNGEWKTIGGSMQETPDWNVNDPSAPGYIANRPFYEEPGIEVIQNARIYLNLKAQSEDDLGELVYVHGNERYYFDYTPDMQAQVAAWTLESVEGDYIFSVDSETHNYSLTNPEIGYSELFTPENFIYGDGDPYLITGATIKMPGTVVHKIDEKYLPEAETIPIKIVHGTLSGSRFAESEGELSREQALAHILLSGGVIAIHVKDDQHGAVMAYSTSVSNGVITFTGDYSWGTVG